MARTSLPAAGMRWIGIVALVTGCAFDAPDDPDLVFEPGPRCEREGDALRCDHLTHTIATGAFGWSAREVHFMLPDGDAPAAGWPTVILFQGSLHSAAGMWESRVDDDFGGYHETELVAALLDGGFAVVTPEARFDGATYWDTNVVPFNVAWDTSEDHQLMLELFAAIEDGVLGPLDPTRLAAAGISSGGYMTSRMAVSYPGRFAALAIQSGSYATCSGALCVVPSLPEDHPPTMFLHGGQDLVVPPDTMEGYAEALTGLGVAVEIVRDEDAGHAWLADAPTRIPAFVRAHLTPGS